MALARALLDAFLPVVAEQDDEPGWWEALLLGVQDFFTVDRVRDTVIIVIAAGLSILLLASWPDPDAIRRIVAWPLLVRSAPTP